MNRISLRYSLLAAALATLAPSAAHGEVLNLQKLGFNARPVTLKLAEKDSVGSVTVRVLPDYEALVTLKKAGDQVKIDYKTCFLEFKRGLSAPPKVKLALSFNYESNGKTHTCLVRVKNKSLTGSAMVAETPIWTSDDEGQVKRDDKAECSYDTRKREAKSKSAFLVIKFPGAEE